MNSKIIDRIREVMGDLGYKPTQFAERIGVNKETVYCWLRGTNGISLRTLTAIAGLAGYSLSGFVEEAEEGITSCDEQAVGFDELAEVFRPTVLEMCKSNGFSVPRYASYMPRGASEMYFSSVVMLADYLEMPVFELVRSVENSARNAEDGQHRAAMQCKSTVTLKTMAQE